MENDTPHTLSTGVPGMAPGNVNRAQSASSAAARSVRTFWSRRPALTALTVGMAGTAAQVVVAATGASVLLLATSSNSGWGALGVLILAGIPACLAVAAGGIAGMAWAYARLGQRHPVTTAAATEAIIIAAAVALIWPANLSGNGISLVGGQGIVGALLASAGSLLAVGWVGARAGAMAQIGVTAVLVVAGGIGATAAEQAAIASAQLSQNQQDLAAVHFALLAPRQPLPTYRLAGVGVVPAWVAQNVKTYVDFNYQVPSNTLYSFDVIEEKATGAVPTQCLDANQDPQPCVRLAQAKTGAIVYGVAGERSTNDNSADALTVIEDGTQITVIPPLMGNTNAAEMLPVVNSLSQTTVSPTDPLCCVD